MLINVNDIIVSETVYADSGGVGPEMVTIGEPRITGDISLIGDDVACEKVMEMWVH